MDRSNGLNSPQHHSTTTTPSDATNAPAPATPQVHAAQPHLPQDVLGYIAACMIPDWTEAPGSSEVLSAYWPIGSAMHGLAAMSQTCTVMPNVIAALRMTRAPQFRAFRREAAHRESAFRMRRGAGRHEALEHARRRYGFVPAFPGRAFPGSVIAADDAADAAMELWQSPDIDGRPGLSARCVRSKEEFEVLLKCIDYRLEKLEHLELDLSGSALEKGLSFDAERLGSAVSQCENLRMLSISAGRELRPEILMALQALAQLRALSLQASPLANTTRVHFDGAFQALPNVFDMIARMPAPEALESLRLESDFSDCLDIARFAVLAPRLTSLRALTLSPCWHKRAQDITALKEALHALPALETVRFDQASWDFAEASAEVLAQHAPLRNVRYRISKSCLLPVLTLLSRHAGLERLEIEFDGDIDARSVALLADMLSPPDCRLQVLRIIASKRVTVDASPLLRALRDNGSLRSLCIGPLRFRPEHIGLLTECLAANRSLRHLGLPEASAETVAAIAAALPRNDSLWSIDLGDKPVSEEAAILLSDGLRGNRSVQQLRMNAEAVSEATRQRIADRLASNRHG